MDSLIGLFDPCVEETSSSSLPPEPEAGNIEYKLKLISPSRHRLEHLVTQMKWRLREGQGEAIYEIGVEDSGYLLGLDENDMSESMVTLRQMASQLGATITVLRERIIDGGNGNIKKSAEVLVRKIPEGQANIDLRIAVIGNAQVGKSTLLGALTQGELDNGRGRTRLNMFRHLHEIQSGRTSSISHEILGFDSSGKAINYQECQTAEEIVETADKLITFIDLAGHQKYLRTTICGLTGYSPHYVMLVVSANTGLSGHAQEHLALALALEVPFFVVVTKIDLIPQSAMVTMLESMKVILQAPGCKKVPVVIKDQDDVITVGSNEIQENLVPIFLVSNVTGEGMHLLTSYLYVLPPKISSKEKERLEQEPIEFQIDETFNIPNTGIVCGGLLTQGVLQEGSPLMLGPWEDGRYEQVFVASVHRNKAPCRNVRAGQSASLAISSSLGKIPKLRRGMVLISSDTQVSASLYFQANVCVLYHHKVIKPGFQTTVYIGNIRQTAIVEAIMSKKLITNEKSSVLFRFIKHAEHVKPGSRLIFREGSSKGIGKVTQVFPMEQVTR